MAGLSKSVAIIQVQRFARGIMVADDSKTTEAAPPATRDDVTSDFVQREANLTGPSKPSNYLHQACPFGPRLLPGQCHFVASTRNKTWPKVRTSMGVHLLHRGGEGCVLTDLPFLT